MTNTAPPPESLWTHIALPVRSLDETMAFYDRYTTLENIHERQDPETKRQSKPPASCSCSSKAAFPSR